MFDCWLKPMTFSRTFGLLLITTILIGNMQVFAQAEEQSKNVQLVESFDLLPSDFELILAVPDLSTLNDRASSINNDLKLKITGLTDLLSEFQRALGMKKGVNANGSLFLVIENLQSLLTPPDSKDPDNPAQSPSPRFLALIPVSDYSAFVSNFGGSPDDLIATLTLPAGQTAFCKIHRRYAIISSSSKMVENYQQGLTRSALSQIIGETGTKVLTQSDISLIIKPQNLSDHAFEQIVNLLKPTPGPENENKNISTHTTNKKSDVDGAIWADIYHNSLLRIVKDSKNIVVGFNSTQEGLNVNLAMNFKSGSQTDNLLTGTAPPSQLLDRIPQRDYLYGTTINLKQIQTQDLLNNLASELNAKGAWYQSLIKEAAPVIGKIQEASQVFYAPKAPINLGTRFMNTVMVLKVDDAQNFLSDVEKFLTDVNGKTYPIGPLSKDETLETDSRSHVTVTSLYADNAINDDRAQIAQYQFLYTLPLHVHTEMSEMGRRMMVLGLNDQQGYIAAVGANTIVITTATDSQLMKDTLTALNRTDSNGLGKTSMLQSATEQGLDSASIQLHLNVRSVMKTTYLLIKLLLEVKDNDPVFPDQLMPLSFSCKTFDDALQAKLHFPMQTIAYLRGDAMSVIELMFPKPIADPNDPNTPINENPDGMQMAPRERGQPNRFQPGGPGPEEF